MKFKFTNLVVAGLVLTLVAGAVAAPVEFSLDRYSRTSEQALGAGPAADSSEAIHNPLGAEGKKRPWIAALETFSINVGVWAIDRYALNKDYSRISWTTIQNNFTHGFIWCPDYFPTSFFGHPYHGSQYFNAARSLGLGFWESIPYSLGGYLMWGFFMENDFPSINDTIMTTLGGVSLGELEYRISSQVLDDSATGGNRVGREILAMLIDPIRGLNRLIYGDMFRISSTNRQLREPFQGSMTLGGMMVSDSSNLTNLHFSPGLSYDMIYGMDSTDIVSGHPFDLIFFNGEIRFAQKKAYFGLSTYAPWYAKEWDGSAGQKYILGLFQHYDYVNNEIMNLGATSTALGFVSLLPLGRGATFKASVQAGAMLMSGVKNDYVRVESRDYNYGLGAMAKVEAWLSHPSLGTLSFHLSHFRFFTIEASANVKADVSRDGLTLLNTQYSLPLSDDLGICLDFGLAARRQHFEGHPSASGDLSRVGAALQWYF